MERGIFGMIGSDIGIDLGTASILVYIKGKGVVLKEPSVVAFDRDTNKTKAIGEEARLMLGRTPGNIVAVRPLRQGVISDYTVTEKMIKYFIQKALGKKSFRKPRISVCVPSGVTEVEKKAVEDATYQAGAREVEIIEEPIAAAIGAGIDISRPSGNMIVDIGGGTCSVAVLSKCSSTLLFSSTGPARKVCMRGSSTRPPPSCEQRSMAFCSAAASSVWPSPLAPKSSTL